jgi:DNA-binding CsgD family transcriptional regulator
VAGGEAVIGALERLPLPVFTIAPDETIDWMNAAGRTAFGDVVGKRFTASFAPESEFAAREAYAQKVTGRVPHTEYEAVMLRADGSRAVGEISSVLMEEKGNVVGVFGLFQPADVPPLPVVPTKELTPRQSQVLRLLARGCSTEQMAEEMGLSQETVRNHVRGLLRRLGVHTRLSAVIVGHERGLL